MTKSEIYELAKSGARERAKALQAEATNLYREFPDQFSAPPEIGLRLEQRNGSGHGPIITALPGEYTGSKASQILPYLVKAGPTRQKDLAAALRLKSVGSLSSVISRHMRAGTIERQAKGLYAATKAGAAAVRSGEMPELKKKNKPTGGSKERARREVSAALLAAIEKESMDGKALADQGHSLRILGPLVRRGYLAQLRNGMYKRTAKPYIVDQRKSAQP